MDNALVFGVGAEQGVGAAACRRFAAEGLRVFAVGRTAERINHVVAGLTDADHEAVAISADCTVAEDVARVFDTIEKETGAPPRLTVYNAGNNFPAELPDDLTNEKFEADWRVCALGALICGREVATRVVPAGGGTLVYTGATASLRSRPPFISFAAAKAAARAVAHGLARQYGKDGLHVAHVILDGAVNGEQVNTRFPQAKDFLGDEGMLAVDSIAGAMWNLHVQDRSAWTLELDLRPYKENF